MTYNEAETRYYLIDPILRQKGYDAHQWLKLETPAPVEPTGPKGRRRRGSGRTDYLLCVLVGKMPKPLPVGLLEAKKESEDPLKGMQQAKGYADCRRHDVKYVFATNGRRYGEFDTFTGLHGGPFPFPDFPSHPDLTARFARDACIDIHTPEAAMLFMADSPAYPQSRYYQDAAIRAAFEKIIHCRQKGETAHVLLAMATGSGKTIIAANLLWRLHEAQCLPKPALFLCDRDELREQAYTRMKAVFGDNARIVETRNGNNAAQNARIHIATYQTLGLDDEAENVASFLSEHYGEDAFSVIIIDECHRSAWGKWSEVLKRNPNAIHIGLTATPRQLRESEQRTEEDVEITANNIQYFGEPVYEYSLIQAQEDGYLAACEIVRRKPSIDWKTFTRVEVLAARPIDARTGRPITEKDLTRDEYGARQFDDELVLPDRIQAMSEDLFEQLCQNGGPEQKVIIFCTREIHADRVAMQMNNFYVKWCRERNQTPKQHYAFKCMGGKNNGADMIEPMRGSGQRAFIACTVDLLEAGVDIERLNAVVFFRYLQSPIKFYQMMGRGSRIHEETGKYKFWLYDYTGVTELFGTDFITRPRRPRPEEPGGNEGGGDEGGWEEPDPEEPPAIAEMMGQFVSITSQGRFILSSRNGRDVPIPVDEYRREMVQRVLREAHSLDQFRGLWIETQKRRQLIDHLLGDNFSPELLRELDSMADFDLYDLFAHHGYRARALKRPERNQFYLTGNQVWFDSVDPKAATVLKGVGYQFEIGGTDALETPALWEVPEIKLVGGLTALKIIGEPADVMRDAKGRLFAA
ncbi:MAG: restriction endonuclease subunit R [Deltaproteobacteria bacterium HGW-Deltaproteobacteria-21]|nr:MAG: restriction endonuclease subunit R [Deltaproteobacteria bacterium HGW-Deltaproteobacteria-21]